MRVEPEGESFGKRNKNAFYAQGFLNRGRIPTGGSHVDFSAAEVWCLWRYRIRRSLYRAAGIRQQFNNRIPGGRWPLLFASAGLGLKYSPHRRGKGGREQ